MCAQLSWGSGCGAETVLRWAGVVGVQGRFKGAVFYQHYWNAPPIHRALLTLSEVVVSTAGPLKDGEEPGANKGRTRAPEEWDSQQRQLRLEARTLKDPPGGSKAAVQDRVRRGVSGLAAAGSGRTVAWWQATALKEYADLRGLQQRLEGQAKVRPRLRTPYLEAASVYFKLTDLAHAGCSVLRGACFSDCQSVASGCNRESGRDLLRRIMN